MSDVKTVGLDLAKLVFQVHGMDAQGSTVFNKKLRRPELIAFFEKLPPCVVAMEACGSSYHWAREITALGHQAKILPGQYVKPFVQRGKTDAADAKAINVAAQQENMRFVQIKSAEQQASMMVIRTRALFIRQRTNVVLALRSHMAEYGLVSDTGLASFTKLRTAVAQADDSKIPQAARLVFNEMAAEIEALTQRIARIDSQIAAHAKRDEDIIRLTTIPGIGTLIASTIKAQVPDPHGFKSGRHFASWLGLTPRLNSSGGKARYGRISKMGNPELRSLLFMGALSVVSAARKDGTASPWLGKLLERRPVKVAVVALANKTARVIWALMTKGGTYHSFSETAAPSALA